MSKQPHKRRHPMLYNVVVIRRSRRRNGCDRNLERQFVACDNRIEGARSKQKNLVGAALHMVEDEVCRGFDGAARY